MNLKFHPFSILTSEAFAFQSHKYTINSVYLSDFPDSSAGKESACSVGDWGLIPGLARSPEEGKSYPLQYSGLENSMDCIVHGVAKDSDHWATFTFTT